MGNTAQKSMTSDQQAAIFHYAKIGLDWVRGRVSLDDLSSDFGKPTRRLDHGATIEYIWFPQNVMSMSFIFDKEGGDSEGLRVSSFNIVINDDTRVDIPYQDFDALGLHRIVRGERLDDERVEENDFFTPAGVLDISGSTPLNSITFSYRAISSENSLFDIRAGVNYLAELRSERGPWNLTNVREAVDFRKLGIYRRYLTPDELQQRNEAKRRKYGYLNLCTGSVCPETGLWEGWTDTGATDVMKVEKGRTFDVVRTEPAYAGGSCPMTEGRWYWLCSPDQIRGFIWHGVTING